jgi:transposase-like protein
MQCKKCQSTHVVKNGRTPAGQQKYHCRDCGVYTVTDDRARDRAAKQELVEKLHRERVSQRGIARVTGTPRCSCARHMRQMSR